MHDSNPRLSPWLFSAALLAGCTGGSTETSSPSVPSPFDTHEVVPTSAYEVLVRFPEGPAGIPTETSNNNLDVASFGGRTYLAWRTAPTHFASTSTELLVASEGPEGWRLEGRFSRGTDLREPRLLALGDRLFLYFAVLGTDPLAFQPQGAMVAEYHGPESWDDPEWLDLPDFIPWRAKTVNGKGYVIGYDGGENIYAFDGKPLRVHLMRTDDGRTLTPADPANPILIEGGASETDFSILDDGTFVSVSRNEAGDAKHGFGSLICRGEPSAIGKVTCRSDKRKFDSPLVFREGKTVWLVGRRNVTQSGNFDLGYDLLDMQARALAYNAEYSLTPKRCALWKVDPDALTVSFVQDLPSRGDTCFAAMTQGEGQKITLYNYTNELEDIFDCPNWPSKCTDLPWGAGQVLPTDIYRVQMSFP